jgi:hypothetical protein
MAAIGSIVGIAAITMLPLPDFLKTLLTPGGVSVLLWAIVDKVKELRPQMTSNQKFYLALALSLVLPTGAYFVQVGLGQVEFDANGVWAAIGVAFTVAYSIHRGTEDQEPKELARLIITEERQKAAEEASAPPQRTHPKV